MLRRKAGMSGGNSCQVHILHYQKEKPNQSPPPLRGHFAALWTIRCKLRPQVLTPVVFGTVPLRGLAPQRGSQGEGQYRSTSSAMQRQLELCHWIKGISFKHFGPRSITEHHTHEIQIHIPTSQLHCLFTIKPRYAFCIPRATTYFPSTWLISD